MASRTKAFISYSHQDGAWRDRLMMHLAVLERREWIHVWTDTRMNVGDTWQTEIEHALRESKVAVLLISPAFLASKFIWQEEVPRIMEHRKAGMLVLPLIARPCAWQLEPALTPLQARPANGRPLSTGSEAQIDLDLTAFAYELASHLQPLATPLAACSWETAERFRHFRALGDVSAIDQPPPKPSNSPALLLLLNKPLSLSWIGRYLPSQSMRFTIRTASEDRVQGIVTYLNDGPLITRRTAEQNRLAGTSERLQTDIAAHITWLNAGIAPLDDASETMLRASPLWRDNDDLLQRAPGLGPVCAWTVVRELPELETLTRQQSAAGVGVAPLNCDRRTLRGRRTIWGGRAHGRTVFSMGTLVATRSNPQSKVFDERLLTAGKGKKVALTACMPKLLTMLNVLRKPRTPWQPQEVQN